MDATNHLQIRPASPEDLPAIYDLMAAFDMVGNFTTDRCIVAEMDDKLVGFARVEVVDEKPYLRPIVVGRQNQGQGVGKELVSHVLGQESELTVISRGSATGFYAQMRFESVGWNDIHLPFRNECAACPDLKVCKPIPMVYRHGANHP
jgi:N-acetylglutamate synthase-like GNAT family acetyltransferase